MALHVWQSSLVQQDIHKAKNACQIRSWDKVWQPVPCYCRDIRQPHAIAECMRYNCCQDMLVPHKVPSSKPAKDSSVHELKCYLQHNCNLADSPPRLVLQGAVKASGTEFKSRQSLPIYNNCAKSQMYPMLQGRRKCKQDALRLPPKGRWMTLPIVSQISDRDKMACSPAEKHGALSSLCDKHTPCSDECEPRQSIMVLSVWLPQESDPGNAIQFWKTSFLMLWSTFLNKKLGNKDQLLAMHLGQESQI